MEVTLDYEPGELAANIDALIEELRATAEEDGENAPLQKSKPVAELGAGFTDPFLKALYDQATRSAKKRMTIMQATAAIHLHGD